MPRWCQFHVPKKFAEIRFAPNGIAGIFLSGACLWRCWVKTFAEGSLSDWHLDLCRLRTPELGARQYDVVESTWLKASGS